MTTFQLLALGLLEALGLSMAVRLWMKKPRPSLLRRVAVSIVLLVPGIGLLLYGFLSVGVSDTHGENPASLSDADYGAGDSGHGL